MKQKELLAALDRDAVVRAIAEAESRCSGEIRVHIEPSLHGREVQFLAERTFERLGMTRTELRNGVLIFLVSKDQQFAVIGDRGIHDKVGPEFWQSVAAHMTEHFGKREFTAGVVEAIREVADRLEAHFPHAGAADRNELTNQVSIGSSEPPNQP